MSEVNIPLLRKVVEWAEAEYARPREIREWEQSQWSISDPSTFVLLDRDSVVFSDEISEHYETYRKSPECGTCYCIAGKVVALTLRDGEYLDGGAIVNSNRDIVCSVVDRACEELGIKTSKFILGDKLFKATNTIKDVRRIAEEIAGERL